MTVVAKASASDFTQLPAQSIDQQINLASEILVRPFERSGTAMWLNLGSINPNHADATAIGEITMTDYMMNVMRNLGARNFLLSNGNSVIDHHIAEELHAYAAYMERQGLVTEGAESRVTLTRDSLDVPVVMQDIAESGRELLPYRKSALLYDLATSAGVRWHGGDRRETIVATNDTFYHKGKYQREIARHGCELLPRLSIMRGLDESEQLQMSHLTDALNYASQFNYQSKADLQTKWGVPCLFAQASVSGGGYRNRVIYKNGGEFVIPTPGDSNEESVHRFNSPTALLRFLREEGLGEVQISPWVKVEQGYSIGTFVSDDGVCSLGPRQQIMTQTDNAYIGWHMNLDSLPNDFVRLNHEIEQSLRFGLKLREMGFRGPYSEDLFEFRTPTGELVVARAEANMRYDAVTMTLGFLFRETRLAQQFMAGKLSVQQEDHFLFDLGAIHNASSRGTTTLTGKLVEALHNHDVCLADSGSNRGFFLLTPAMQVDANTAKAVVACIAPSDGERNRHLGRVRQTLGAKTH